MPGPNEESDTRCPACGRPLRSGARFCPACGQGLTVSAVPPARSGRTSLFIRYSNQLSELKRVGWLFGLLLLGSFVLGMISRVDDSPLPDAVITGVEALLVLVFVALRSEDVTPLLGLPRVNARDLLL